VNIFDASNDGFFKYYLTLLKSALDGTRPSRPPVGFSFARLYDFSARNHTAHMLYEPLKKLEPGPYHETR